MAVIRSDRGPTIGVGVCPMTACANGATPIAMYTNIQNTPCSSRRRVDRIIVASRAPA